MSASFSLSSLIKAVYILLKIDSFCPFAVSIYNLVSALWKNLKWELALGVFSAIYPFFEMTFA